VRTQLTDVPEALHVDFDIYDHRLSLQLNDLMRSYPPVCFTGRNGGHWIVTGYDLVRQVLTDPGRFTSENQSIPPKPPDEFGSRPIPLYYDPPEHSEYRQILLPLFSPRQVETLTPRLTALADDLIDQFCERGECDYIADFAGPFPAIAFLTLMGWPLDERETFSGWVKAIMYGGLESDADEAARLRGEAREKVHEYFSEFLRASRCDPLDDLTGALIRARLSHTRSLSDAEILNFMSLLMVAGLHTVQGALAYAVMHFSRATDDREAVIRDPETLDSAVEEILRMEPPAWGIARGVKQDLELLGVKMREGDVILLPVQTANRDGHQFSEPDAFQRARDSNTHLTFGAGPHRCMGSHLARLEMRIGLSRLHARLPDYLVDSSLPLVTHLSQVRGVEEMHLKFTPSKRLKRRPDAS
jgi:cytochrome P450